MGGITVARQYKDGQIVALEQCEYQEVESAIPQGVPVANVSVFLGVTLNMGNFKSARVDVGLSLPALVDDVENAYQAAREFVDRKLREEIPKANQYFNYEEPPKKIEKQRKPM